MNPRRALRDAPFTHTRSDGLRFREVLERCQMLTGLGDSGRSHQLARRVNLLLDGPIEHRFLDVKLADHVAHRVVMGAAVVTGREYRGPLGKQHLKA